ncbi:MAG: PAS domain S-box protein [Candidatus Bathyarchaeota archaeon]|nr:PAS domain S-box protein [Candidatus Bathyarchaeota archaeon]
MSVDSFSNNLTEAFGADKKQFNMFFEKMMDGFAYHRIVVDKDGKPLDYVFLEVNPAFEKMTGLKREEVIGKKVTEVLKGIEKDSADWIGRYGKVALTGEPAQFESYSGHLGKWYNVSAYSPENGYFVAIFEEITERKKALEEIKKAKDDWERTFDAVPDLIAIIDLNHRLVRANKPMAEQLGVTPQQAVGQKCYKCVHGTDAPPENCPHTQTIEDGQRHIAEVHEPRLGGDFIVSTTPLRDHNGELVGSIHVAHDITKRKQAEEELKKLNDELEEKVQQRTKEIGKERQRLYNVLETLPSYVCLLDENYSMPFANKVFREQFGESKGGRCYEFLFNRDSPCEDCETYKVLKTKRPHRWEWTGPNGRDYDIYDFPFYEADGSMLILEMGVDVTDRKKVEATVQTERKRLYDVLETLPTMVALLTPDRHIAFANRSFREKFGESKGRYCYESCFGKAEPCGFCESFTPLKTGKPHHWEVKTSDGSIIDAHDFPFTDADGSPMILEMDMDITAQRLAESELKKYREHLEQLVTERASQLRESEQRWATTLSSIGDAVIATDTDAKITFMNAVAEALTGWTLKEVEQKPIAQVFNIINEQTGEEVENPVTKVLEKGVIVGLANHTLLVRKDGTKIPIDDSGAPIVTNDGVFKGVVLVFRDITERRKAERALRESEERLKRSQEIAHLGSWELDLAQNKLTWSDEVYRIFGLKPQEFGATYEAFLAAVHPDDRPAVDQAYSSSVSEDQCGYEIEHRVVRKDNGEIRIVHEKCTHIRDETGRIIRSLGMVHDITERKKAEEAIQRQAALIDLSPDAIIVRKVDGTITFWSRGAEKLYGWSKAEAVGKRTHALLRTEFPQPFEVIVAELKTKFSWSGEVVQHTKDGQAVTMQSWWLAEKTEHGEVTSILESNVDLTERKEAEREIARLATFPTLNPNPIIEVDLNGEITYANPATKLLFPDLEKEGLNHVFLSGWKIVKQAFADKSINAYGTEMEINGHWYHQQFYRFPQTELIRIYTTDIDELKQTELARAKAQAKLEENALVLEEYASQMEELAEQRAKQLQSAERLAAIGQTAGMVGHDIRNPLQAITSDMYIIAQEVKDLQDGESKEAILESIESVNQNLTYINKIVSDLQDYTRPLKPNLQASDLSELVEGTLLTINIPKDIEVQTQIHAEAQPIVTDVAYMRRILTNLITNAIQAMTNGGNLTIAASKKESAVAITIQDTGVGISQDVRAKMFTPLFTTKSKGQGLGLAVVKRLVDALGGTIDFESQTNSGTKFILHFPLSANVKSTA